MSSTKQLELTSFLNWYDKQTAAATPDQPFHKTYPIDMLTYLASAAELVPDTDLDKLDGTSGDEYEKLVRSFSWPTGVFVCSTPPPPPTNSPPPSVNVVSTNTTAASAILYAQGIASEHTDHYKFVKALADLFGTQELSVIRNLCTSFLQASAPISEDVVLGEPQFISLNAYNDFIEQQKGKTLRTGPWQFWTVLERAGFGCESFVHNGSDAIKYESNGVTLVQFDKFMVHIERDGGYHVATGDEVSQFIGRRQFKGQFFTYSPISMDAFVIVNAFISAFDVSIQNNELQAQVARPLSTTNPYKRFNYKDKSLTGIFDSLQAAIAKTAIKGKGRESFVESMARWVESNATPEVIKASASAISLHTTQTIKTFCDTLTSELATTKKLDKQAREQYLIKKTASDPTPNSSITKLNHAREMRNKGLRDYVNHGVGSVVGPTLLEWYDTHMKGRHMIDVAQSYPPYASRNEDDLTLIYGVAHGHMVDAFNDIRVKGARPEKMMFLDKQKAKGSTEMFTVGDVYQMPYDHAWIFDDTNSHKLPKHLNATVHTTGDHYKVSNFLKHAPKFVLTKVSLENFKTEQHWHQWDETFKSYQYRARLLKLGRLHNAECFMLIVPNRAGNNMEILRGDAKSISICIDLTNTVIMKWQSVGARAGFYDPLSPKPIDLRQLWLDIISTLPVNWPWYFKKFDVTIKRIAEADEAMVSDYSYADELFDMSDLNAPPQDEPVRWNGFAYKENGEVFKLEGATIVNYGLPAAIRDLAAVTTQYITWDESANSWKSVPTPKDPTSVIRYPSD